MRPLFDSMSRLALAASFAVMIGTAVTLREGAEVRYDTRDAYAEKVERGELVLRQERLAAEWRSEIAAQRATMRRDIVISRILLATGLVLLVVLVGTLLSQRATGRSASLKARGLTS